MQKSFANELNTQHTKKFMKFIFIAVNYNGAIHTENYLKSLHEAQVPDSDTIEAIIVDNNSSKADLEQLNESISKYPFSRLITLENNIGYFRGLNAGIDTCTKNKDTLLIVGNNDLKFDSDFIFKLKNIPYDNEVLVIAPNITTLDGRQQNPHVIDKVSTLELLKTRIYFSNYYISKIGQFISSTIKKSISILSPINSKKIKPPEHKRMKIKRGIGACYVLTPNFFHHYERLDDRVFLWGEEALLSHQVESVNGITLYDPEIKILHHESASVKSIVTRKKYDIVKESYQIYKDFL